MLSCKEVSCLVSESLDRELPLRRRIALRMHLLMCSLCSRFHRQLRFLHKAARAFDEASTEDRLPGQVRLSPEARERIKKALKRNSG